MRHTCASVLAVVAFAGLLSSPANTAPMTADHVDGSGREQASPVDTGGPRPQAKYKGLTSGEWLAVWWQAVFATSIEGGSHPLIDGGAFGGNNRTVFLAGPVLPAGSPKVTTRVTIPPGTYLVVPIITVECSVAEAPPFHGEDEAQLRACANGLLDLVSDPYAEIDGTPVHDPGAYRVESPLFRYGPLTTTNVLGLPPGTQSDAVGAGYVLLLPPFSVGVHRISVRANVAAFGLATDAEFIINVEPPREW
jgi:hypothetical protein